MAAQGKRISGIYVPIQLDTTQIQADMERLRSTLDSSGAALMRSFQNTLNPRNIAKGFGDMIKAVGTLRDSMKALEALKPMGAFQNTLQSISPELRTLGQTLGLTMRAQQELLHRMAENQAINAQVNALRTLERTLGTTREETLKLAQSYGMAVSDMARQRFVGQGQISEVQKLTEEYNKLTRLAGQANTKEGLQKFIDTAKIRDALAAFKQLNPSLELTQKNFEEIARAAGVAVEQVRELAEAGKEGGGRGIWGIFSPSNMTAGLQSAMGAAGVVGGMYGVIELGKASVKAALEMDNITKAFESIYNSAPKAERQLKFIRDTSDKLGLSFKDTADSAKSMFASFQGTVLEKDANKIFTAFSNMGAAMKLTNDEMSGVFLAISQMASKGKVSAEELRQQLAERMPGAVTLFAKSIGVSTQQLDKMLQDGAVGLEHLAQFAEAVQEKYQAGAAAASTGLQAELNRVGNAWFDLKRAFVDSDTIASGVRGIGKALRFLADNAEGVNVVVANFGKMIVMTAAVYGFAKAVQAVATTIKELGVVGAATSGMQSFLGVIKSFPHPGILAAAAVSGLALWISNLGTEMTEGEKVMAKYAKGFEAIWEGADRAGASIEEMTEKQKKVEFERLRLEAEKAARDLKALFRPESLELPTDIIDSEFEDMIDIFNNNAKSAIQSYFDTMRTTMLGSELHGVLNQAEAVAIEFGKQMTSGIAKGFKAEELQKIWKEAEVSFQQFANMLDKIGADDEALKSFAKIQHVLKGISDQVIKTATNFENFSKTSSKAAETLTAEAQTAFDSISKLTKGTAVAKERALAEEFENIAKGLVKINQAAFNAAEEMDKLEGSVEDNTQKWGDLQQQVDNMTNILPQVASLAVQNGRDFETMAASLMEAGIQAGYTLKQLIELRRVLQSSFNVEVGKVITGELQKLDLQIAQLGAKAKDTKAFSILSQVVKDADDQLKLFNAIAQKDVKTLGDLATKYGAKIEDFDKVIAKSELFGAKSEASKGGGRSGSRISQKAREAQKDLSDLEKAIASTEKKIGALQSKINEDPSIKYWADVKAEIEKINTLIDKQGGKNAAQVQHLTELRDQYARLAEERAQQMAEEERRQKIINALQMAGQGYGKLGNVNRNASAGLNIEALNAQYKENVQNYQKMVDDKIMAEEEFDRIVGELNQELNIKTAQANGSMLASFTAALQVAAQDLRDWQDQVSDILVGAMEDMSDAFADFVVTGMKNSEDLGQAFKSMVDGMIQDLARLFMRMIIMSATSKLFGAFFGGAQSGQVIGWTTAGAGGGFTGPVTAAAKGGVFTGGNISNFSGRVVPGPTLFSGTPLRAFAKGGNIMGEKGPEAVLPLTRGSNGKLGVEATTAATSVEMQQSISVNVYNNTDSQITTTQSRDNNGNLDIQVMIEKMVGESMVRTGSSPFRALRGTWGASPKLASRG